MMQMLEGRVRLLDLAAVPCIAGITYVRIVLLDNIGLVRLAALEILRLTGVGGLTSFGQAAFCGFGAYTTAVLTIAYGVSPRRKLALSFLASRPAAVVRG